MVKLGAPIPWHVDQTKKAFYISLKAYNNIVLKIVNKLYFCGTVKARFLTASQPKSQIIYLDLLWKPKNPLLGL